MIGNTSGHVFKITTFGESHGKAVGAVIDGCPAGLILTEEDIQKELDRRKPGKTAYESPRKENDKVEIISGVYKGKTLGTPITLLVWNKNQDSSAYEKLKNLYRPGHADFTYDAKYGFRDWRGGGRASGRETLARTACGAVAKKILKQMGITVSSKVCTIGGVEVANKKEIEKIILEAMHNKDSVGGIVEVKANGVPAGLGEPVFHKLSADFASALVSIPGVKGFEIGDGFLVSKMYGSQNNDEFVMKNKKITTKTNHAGGILGGISNGEEIVLRIAIKPPSSIAKKQRTVTSFGKNVDVDIAGRHDPCICERVLPVAEAMVALTLVDHVFLNRISRL